MSTHVSQRNSIIMIDLYREKYYNQVQKMMNQLQIQFSSGFYFRLDWKFFNLKFDSQVVDFSLFERILISLQTWLCSLIKWLAIKKNKVCLSSAY